VVFPRGVVGGLWGAMRTRVMSGRREIS
jgi:hypothetical protein